MKPIPTSCCIFEVVTIARELTIYQKGLHFHKAEQSSRQPRSEKALYLLSKGSWNSLP